MKPGQYKKQFGIPSKQPLTAKSFTEARRQMAMDRGLADNLAKARGVRAANISAKKAAPAKGKKAAPAKPVKATQPKAEKKGAPAKAKKAASAKVSKAKSAPKG